MSSAISALYEPLIERDLDAIPAAVARFRESQSSDELLAAVTRFAVLAYAPSQHAKHAVLCCLSAHELRAEIGDRLDDLLVECARYCAESRQPWSEPPIADPPALESGDTGALEDLIAAIESGDHSRGERWLARRIDDESLARDYFAAAIHDFEDLGHKLIIAVASWKIAALFPPQGRLATLRVGIREMTAYTGERPPSDAPIEPAALCAQLLDDVAGDDGSIVSAHTLFLLDAALEAAEIARDPAILTTTCAWLERGRSAGNASTHVTATTPLPIYKLSRDCGSYLKSWVVARRLAHRFPAIDGKRLVEATSFNLQNAASLADWSFA